MGRLNNFSPKVYFGLKLQTPLSVKITSHIIKKVALMKIPINKGFQSL
jgi:hypothetical protein